MKFRALLLWLVMATYAVAQPTTERAPLEIVRITPSGENVPASKQLVIQFNRPVVPLGNMEREANSLPITISPPLACAWRWLNSSALACNLKEKEAMQPATAYHVTITQGITAEDGATIAEVVHHRFTTERPDVRSTYFKEWRNPAMPVFQLYFNQPVTQASVQEAIYITPASDKKPLSLVATPMPEDNSTADTHAARDRWLAQPAEPLTPDTAFTMRVRAGLVSALGDAHGTAERDLLDFHSFPEQFRFKGVKCYTNEDDATPIIITYRENTDRLCNPMRGAALLFSRPVFKSQVKKHLKITPALQIDAEDKAWGEVQDYSQLTTLYQQDKSYEIWLPAGIKAASSYTLDTSELQRTWWQRLWAWVLSWFTEITEDDTLRDEFGMALQAPIHFTFATNHRKPNVELIHHDAVLEKQTDSDVPLYVNNVEKTELDYRRITAQGVQEALHHTHSIPHVIDKQFAIPMQVREMLQGKSGVVYGTLRTTPTVEKYENAYRLFAQVTPFQVQAKIGHFNSMVWITDFATGLPVKDATIALYKDSITGMHTPLKTEILSTATTQQDGTAQLDGTAEIDPLLLLQRAWKDEEERLFIRVEKEGEVAFLPLAYAYQIDAYRSVGESVYPENKVRHEHMKAWGTTAQGVYRAGDTMQYKLYVREQDNKRFIPAPASGYRLEISDPTGKIVHKVKNITLNEVGAYAGEFTTSNNAAVGWYQFTLNATFAKKKNWNGEEESLSWQPMRVLVSDFTPSPFKVSNQLHGELFSANHPLKVTSNATLHSGGAYSDAAIRVTGLLQSRTFTSAHPLTKEFSFGSYTGQAEQQQLFQEMGKLNDKGDHHINTTLPAPSIYYGRIMVESAVQDDRGKYVTTSNYADYAGVDRFVGMRMGEWMITAGKQAAIDYVVTDSKGAPMAGTPTTLLIEKQETKAARVKGAGNAYTTEYSNEWVEAGKCAETSGTTPLTCHFTPKEAGYYRVTATINDTENRPHHTELYVYAVGNGYVLWNTEDEHALEIIPEKATYQVGDTARYLIKNPYPDAQALITIERYGVIDHFVQPLKGSTPTIEFEVKPDYLPGFYMSVTVFSPRVEQPITGQVDLGKPTFKTGYVTVPIHDPYKEMQVKVTTDKEVYRPRERVTLTLHAAPRHADTPEPIEIAVAVVDESVFDLIAGGKDYYNPYKGFYQLEGLDVRNYSLLTRLVGRQKFEKKGANQGGDGGVDIAMRNIFKFVSYWNPSILPDKEGNATVQFDVPDNLTGWRVLAMAVTPTDRMGLGEGHFKVNRPTEIRPVMPNQVHEGDVFEAGFSVMNRSDKTRTLTVDIAAQGDIDAKEPMLTKQETITLAPYKRKIVNLTIPTRMIAYEKPHGTLHFSVEASDAIDGDAITHDMTIYKKRSMEVAAEYGSTTEAKATQSLQIPANIYPDIGDIRVTLSPTVLANITGAFRYMRDYPYACWEQRLSKAVMAAHYLGLRDYLPDSLTWKEAQALPNNTLQQAGDFQAPNGGMTYFVAQDAYADPYLSSYTALGFQWLREQGYNPPALVEEKLHDYLQQLLRQDNTHELYDKASFASVRAVALAALSTQGKVTSADLQRLTPYLPQMGLFGKALWVQAALHTKNAENDALEGVRSLLSQAHYAAGKVSFNEEIGEGSERLLSTPLREQCVLLSLFTTIPERHPAYALVQDLPMKLVRSIAAARGNRDHFENTQENLFCMQALARYAARYEVTSPAMQVQATLDSSTLGEAQFNNVKDAPITFTSPLMAKETGAHRTMMLTRTGKGRLYYTTRLTYALKEDHMTSVNAGMEIIREYSVQRGDKWELLTKDTMLHPSDIVRVDLYVSLPTARHFVVVEDPMAGGLEPVNRQLTTSSELDSDKASTQAADGSWWFKEKDWIGYHAGQWGFYHQELKHDVARFYADYLPADNYHLSYSTQVIAQGQFAAPPPQVQEMYDTDIYGKGVATEINVVK